MHGEINKDDGEQFNEAWKREKKRIWDAYRKYYYLYYRYMRDCCSDCHARCRNS